VTRYLILHREKREQEWDTSYEREEEQLDDLRRDHEQEGGRRRSCDPKRESHYSELQKPHERSKGEESPPPNHWDLSLVKPMCLEEMSERERERGRERERERGG
jgi:hypothetical protein